MACVGHLAGRSRGVRRLIYIQPKAHACDVCNSLPLYIEFFERSSTRQLTQVFLLKTNVMHILKNKNLIVHKGIMRFFFKHPLK